MNGIRVLRFASAPDYGPNYMARIQIPQIGILLRLYITTSAGEFDPNDNIILRNYSDGVLFDGPIHLANQIFSGSNKLVILKFKGLLLQVEKSGEYFIEVIQKHGGSITVFAIVSMIKTNIELDANNVIEDRIE